MGAITKIMKNEKDSDSYHVPFNLPVWSIEKTDEFGGGL